MAPLRPGRSGEVGGRGSLGGAGEEQRMITWPTQPGKPAELPGRSPALQVPPLPVAAWSWGHRKNAEGRTGEAGGRGPPGQEEQEEQERRGEHLPHPLEPWKPAGLGPLPSETRGGGHAWAPSVP